MNNALCTVTPCQFQDGQESKPHFASLRTLLIDPRDRDDNRRRKALLRACGILSQFDDRAEALQDALATWGDRHLGAANEEIRAWYGGTQAMLDRRRRLIEQIRTLLDEIDESFDEEALRDEMILTLADLADLAEHETSDTEPATKSCSPRGHKPRGELSAQLPRENWKDARRI